MSLVIGVLVFELVVLELILLFDFVLVVSLFTELSVGG